MAMPAIDWTPELKAEIIERITQGETIYSIFADPRLPARNSFYLACARDPSFNTEIVRARKVGARKEFDDFITLADQADKDNYNAIKVRLWARTWALGRLDPREYGDKLQHTGDGDGPIEIVVKHIGANNVRQLEDGKTIDASEE